MSVESVTQAVSNLALAFGDDDSEQTVMVSETLMWMSNKLLAELHVFLCQVSSESIEDNNTLKKALLHSRRVYVM